MAQQHEIDNHSKNEKDNKRNVICKLNTLQFLVVRHGQ